MRPQDLARPRHRRHLAPKLAELGALSSYSHRGRFHTLPEVARFDRDGLWSHAGVRFSRHTLRATLESWIADSVRGWFADELADRLHVAVHDPLRQLAAGGRLGRSEIGGRLLYTAAAPGQADRQTRAPRGEPTRQPWRSRPSPWSRPTS